MQRPFASIVALGVAALGFVWSAPAPARPGGGQSFRSGSSSSGGKAGPLLRDALPRAADDANELPDDANEAA